MSLRLILGLPFLVTGYLFCLYLMAVEFTAFLTPFGVTSWLDWVTQCAPEWWCNFVKPDPEWGFIATAFYVAIPTSLTLTLTGMPGYFTIFIGAAIADD